MRSYYPQKKKRKRSLSKTIVLGNQAYKKNRNTLIKTVESIQDVLFLVLQLFIDDDGVILVNGTEFIWDTTHTKLLRKAKAVNATSSEQTTPKKVNINGLEYFRTKRGNLVRADLAKQAKLGRYNAFLLYTMTHVFDDIARIVH